MRLRTLCLAAVFAFGAIAAPLAFVAVTAESDVPVLTTDELMRVTALDEIFTQFGAGIATAPLNQNVPIPGATLAVWDEAARATFIADDMHAELATTLEGKFSEEENIEFATFFRSPFGERVSKIERDVTVLGPESQEMARQEGLRLAAGASDRRYEQIEEMLVLVSAELSTSMVSESIRGMMIGMAMTQQQGDIQVPWEEIDARIEEMMPAIEADVAVTQRAMMFYAYRDLTEANLDDYIAFLRTDAAKRFYAISAFSVGEIIADRMRTFGETLAAMLRRVNV